MFLSVLEGGFAAAAILVSFGVVIGKITPLQLLFIIIMETLVYALNWQIGYNILLVVDAGGTMFIHTFGAYFGVFMSLALRAKNYKHPKTEELQNSRYNSDHFSFVGSFLLWVFWPSFNAYATEGKGRERALTNTYLSMCASTILTLILSPILNKDRKFSNTDLQNATLAGGVAVGCACHLLIQPWGALIAGSIAGVISMLGYNIIQVKFQSPVG